MDTLIGRCLERMNGLVKQRKDDQLEGNGKRSEEEMAVERKRGRTMELEVKEMVKRCKETQR